MQRGEIIADIPEAEQREIEEFIILLMKLPREKRQHLKAGMEIGRMLYGIPDHDRQAG